jgi:hypothetical protein
MPNGPDTRCAAGVKAKGRFRLAGRSTTAGAYFGLTEQTGRVSSDSVAEVAIAVKVNPRISVRRKTKPIMYIM